MNVLARAFFQTALWRLTNDHPLFIAAGYSAERLAVRAGVNSTSTAGEFGHMLELIECDAKEDTGDLVRWLQDRWTRPQDQKDLEILTCKNRAQWLEFGQKHNR